MIPQCFFRRLVASRGARSDIRIPSFVDQPYLCICLWDENAFARVDVYDGRCGALFTRMGRCRTTRGQATHMDMQIGEGVGWSQGGCYNEARRRMRAGSHCA